MILVLTEFFVNTLPTNLFQKKFLGLEIDKFFKNLVQFLRAVYILFLSLVHKNKFLYPEVSLSQYMPVMVLSWEIQHMVRTGGKLTYILQVVLS